MSPYFSSIQEFIQMGGHGAFVWACYGLTFGCLFLLMWYAKNERKNTINQLNRQSANKKNLTNKQRQQLNV